MSCNKHSDKNEHTQHQCCGNDHTSTHVHNHEHCDIDQVSSSDPIIQNETESNCETPDDEDPEPASKTEYKKLSWLIENIDCPSCAIKITNAVKKIPEAKNVRVIFATQRLLVDIEQTNSSNKISIAIIKAVKNAGFNLSANIKKEPLKISQKELFIKHFHAIVLIMAILFAVFSKFYFPSYSENIFIFATLWGVFPIVNRAIKLLRSGSPFSIETLMSIATLGALFLGETAESSMILLLFMIGEKLESFAATKARKGVQELISLVPNTVVKIVGDQKIIIESSELAVGDIIEVKPGERLAADAILLSKEISFDESALTGESIPVEHKKGDLIMAGSMATTQVSKLRVVSEAGNNAIDKILHMIEEAQENKAPIERVIEKFSSWYTPLMISIAFLVIVIPPLAFGADWDVWIYKGLALLLIGCPCALVISTPAAITSSLSVASKRGVIIKGGAALETLALVKHIAFDKTGTLTQGKPKVTEVIGFDISSDKLLQLAASVEQTSNHPLAKAIVNKAKSSDLKLLEASNDKTLVGFGIQAEIEDQIIKLIAPRHLSEQLLIKPKMFKQISELENGGNTTILVLKNEIIIGLIAIADQIRDDAIEAINMLNKQNISTLMLTGDNERTAKVIASKLGIEYKAQLLPRDKLLIIEELNKVGNCAMVGDGINDAPAMKTASIGIAMGGGTDVAMEVSEITLINNSLIELPALIKLSHATLDNIKQNITLALGLKFVFLLTTLFGFTGLWVAVLADSGATALVTANALRLLKFNKKFDKLNKVKK